MVSNCLLTLDAVSLGCAQDLQVPGYTLLEDQTRYLPFDTQLTPYDTAPELNPVQQRAPAIGQKVFEVYLRRCGLVSCYALTAVQSFLAQHGQLVLSLGSWQC